MIFFKSIDRFTVKYSLIQYLWIWSFSQVFLWIRSQNTWLKLKHLKNPQVKSSLQRLEISNPHWASKMNYANMYIGYWRCDLYFHMWFVLNLENAFMEISFSLSSSVIQRTNWGRVFYFIIVRMVQTRIAWHQNSISVRYICYRFHISSRQSASLCDLLG